MRKQYNETDKKFINFDDREVGVLDKLNAYFKKHPDGVPSFVAECHRHMGRWGRITRAQYDTLRSIWNNLDESNVEENRESC